MTDVVKEIENNKIIAVLRNVESDKLLPLVSAIKDGGISIVEIPFSLNKKTAEDILMLTSYFKESVCVGVGTVVNKKQVKLAKKSGAKFIVSPATDKKVIKYTKRQKLVSVAGAFSPTEIMEASSFGTDFIKIFPSNILGIKLIKAIKSPFPTQRFLMFGGITNDNLKEFIDNGATGCGIGEYLVNTDYVKNGEYDKITEIAKKLVEAIK